MNYRDYQYYKNRSLALLATSCLAILFSCGNKQHPGASDDGIPQERQEQPVSSTGKKKAKTDMLPKAAIAILNEHFADLTVKKVKNVGVATNRYEVKFTNGDEMEFDADGCVTEVNTKGRAVPDALVPQPIRDYVASNYPDANINDIEFGERKIEIKLDGDVELVFNASNYRLLDIDY